MNRPSTALRLCFASALAICVLALPGGAEAGCSRFVPGDQDIVLPPFPMPNVDRPDAAFGPFSNGFVEQGFECTAGQTAFVVDLTVPGLAYERDISYRGLTFRAYSVGPRSPLIGFHHVLSTGGGASGQILVPLALGRNRNPGPVLATTTPVASSLYIMLFARGGAMESFPATALGFATSSVESDPSQTMQHAMRLEVTIHPATCSITSTSHALDNVVANDLAASGSNAKESSFDVMMDCPMGNIDVHLSLADANNPGSSNDQLAPAPGATAGGVQVQLLRGGLPVQFGRVWSHGCSSKVSQSIPFSACYLRTADSLVPGEVKGEAVLTAVYR